MGYNTAGQAKVEAGFADDINYEKLRNEDFFSDSGKGKVLRYLFMLLLFPFLIINFILKN